MQKCLMIGSLLLTAVFLPACDKTPPSSASASNINEQEQQSKQLLNDIAGVWNDGSTMWTIVVDGGQLQFLLDDNPIAAKIGDIDTDNKTVNLLLDKEYFGKNVIWTIREIKANNGSEGYTLNVITHEGKTYDLGFVRKIGVDDKNRIHNLFLEAEQKKRDAQEQSLVEQQPEEDITSAEDQANIAAQQAAQAQIDADAALQTSDTSSTNESDEESANDQSEY